MGLSDHETSQRPGLSPAAISSGSGRYRFLCLRGTTSGSMRTWLLQFGVAIGFDE